MREWPTEVNGHLTRPRFGNCPECGAPEDRWCDERCSRLDPMDYR
jgi:hypothetical protein